jgi:hypothetical protein
MTVPVLSSRLRCPACGREELLQMPSDACTVFHVCTACGAMLRPQAGDCCVFCSYGSAPCPPVQLAASGGGCGAERNDPSGEQ